MTGFRSRILLVIAATAGLAAVAWAEGIFPVNDAGSGNWVFDQPSVAANGNVLHLAFVGDNTAGADGSPNTRIYYAAVNGGADSSAGRAIRRSRCAPRPSSRSFSRRSPSGRRTTSSSSPW
jgi:hypothetical protein